MIDSSLPDGASPRSVMLQRFDSFALLVVLAVNLIGCGPRTDKLSLSGNVTLDGSPLDKGTIQFTTLGEGKLQSTGSAIQDGAYHIPAEKGLLPGTYRVELSSPDGNAPPVRVAAYPGGPTIPVVPDRIPAEYNIDSSKSVEVTQDGDNQFDFAVTSATKK